MGTYGRTVIATTGNPITVIADGRTDWFKVGGVTIDWTTVTAVSGADKTLADGTIVKIGDKYIRYGTVLCKITASGKYGPNDTGASDGRQTLTRGECYILNQTVVMSALGSDHPPVFDGGTVFADRLVNLAIQPTGGTESTGSSTLANILAAFPRVTPVKD